MCMWMLAVNLLQRFLFSFWIHSIQSSELDSLDSLAGSLSQDLSRSQVGLVKDLIWQWMLIGRLVVSYEKLEMPLA